MKTNTLLAAAAILAVGGLAAQAQVYSQNVVGYFNTTIASHSFSIVANQLINGNDSSGTNNSINAALNTGLASDPNGGLNTVLYFWNGNGYGVYQYYTGADADYNYGLSGSLAGWYDSNGNYISATLPQGGGSFLYNPSTTNVTLTVVGTVPQGTNILSIKQGFNMLSIVEPVSTNLESSIVGFPGTSDPNGNNNDVLYKWNGGGYGVFQYYIGADADYNYGLSGSVNGFYDSNGNLINSTPSVGQSFFIYHIVPATVLWTNTFSVQ